MFDLQTILKNNGINSQRDSDGVFKLPDGYFAWQPGRQSLVLNSQRNLKRFQEDRVVERKILSSSLWSELKKQPCVLLVDGSSIRELLQKIRLETQNASMFLPMFAPILEEANAIGVSIATDKQMKVRSVVACNDTNGVKRFSKLANRPLSL